MVRCSPLKGRIGIGTQVIKLAGCFDTASNNGMHPTADTEDFIISHRAGRRVMPGVRLLLRSKEFCWMNARASRMAEARGRSVAGHNARPDLGASRWREAWRGLNVSPSAAGGVTRAKDVPQSNKRMHATADTQDFMFQ